MELESRCRLDYIICVGLVVISCRWMVNMEWFTVEMDAYWYWFGHDCALATAQSEMRSLESTKNGLQVDGECFNLLYFWVGFSHVRLPLKLKYCRQPFIVPCRWDWLVERGAGWPTVVYQYQCDQWSMVHTPLLLVSTSLKQIIQTSSKY